jgi:hypothetical protein
MIAAETESDARMSQEMQVLTSTKTVEWFTPPWLVDLARGVLGEIDLDPASHDVAQGWIAAKTYYTKVDNGLKFPWTQRIYMNPPYGRKGTDRTFLWTTKLIEEYESANVTEAVLLVNATLGYHWFERLFGLYPVCFLRDRVHFIDESRQASKHPAKKGSAVFYLGPMSKWMHFHDVFSPIGRVVFP